MNIPLCWELVDNSDPRGAGQDGHCDANRDLGGVVAQDVRERDSVIAKDVAHIDVDAANVNKATLKNGMARRYEIQLGVT
jgi:hypothetical protein